MPRIIITGGPGAGKTSLLVALKDRGYSIVGDTARTIIQNRRRLGLSPRPSAAEFVQQTLRVDIENFVRHAATPGHVFYERGVLDSLCMLDVGEQRDLANEISGTQRHAPHGQNEYETGGRDDQR
jgi:predicted ATPase